MLKFRMSNSMRARRSAEAQRKALEEKLKMEWAWKPMAAIMNEKESDLVYWVPPLYTSNLLTSFSASSSMYSSLSSSPSSSIRRASMQYPSTSGLVKNSPSIRRKHTSLRKRPRLTPNESIQEDEDEQGSEPLSSLLRDGKDEGEKKQLLDDSNSKTEDEDHKEIDIQLDTTLEDDDSEETFKVGRKPMRQNAYRIRHSCPENISIYSEKQHKFRHIPTLYKVVNKLSQIYNFPSRSSCPNDENKRFNRSKEFRNSTTRRAKRPSVKIYNVPSSRSSVKKGNLTEANAIPDPYYVISKTKTPFMRAASTKGKAQNNRTHIGLPTMSENELHSAHLDMILRILANLYKEKLAEQTTEISHFKTKLQGQEKVLKQTAHLALELKDQLKMLQTKFENSLNVATMTNQEETDTESLFNYHQLEPSIQESPSDTPLSERRQHVTSLYVNKLADDSSDSESAKGKFNFSHRPFVLGSFDSIFEDHPGDYARSSISTLPATDLEEREDHKCSVDDKYFDTQSMASYQIAINLSPKFSAPSSPNLVEPGKKFVTTAEVYESNCTEDKDNLIMSSVQLNNHEDNNASSLI